MPYGTCRTFGGLDRVAIDLCFERSLDPVAVT
jgi:hypothetical protein